MIEAVNSVLANASLSRGSTVQASNAARVEPQTVAQAPQAPYISPYIALDYNTNQAVIQIRDSDTGDVLTQFPSESRVRELQAEQAQRQAQLQQGASSAPQASSEQPAVASSEGSIPVQSLDAGAIATLQAPQGVSTSQIQQAAVAFSANTAASASVGTVNVTA